MEFQSHKRIDTQVLSSKTRRFDFQNGLVLELNVKAVSHQGLDSKPVFDAGVSKSKTV